MTANPSSHAQSALGRALASNHNETVLRREHALSSNHNEAVVCRPFPLTGRQHDMLLLRALTPNYNGTVAGRALVPNHNETVLAPARPAASR